MNNENFDIDLKQSMSILSHKLFKQSFNPVMKVLMILIVSLFFCQPSFSQESSSKDQPVKAAKYKNVTWYGVGRIKFKPGKMHDAMNIIKKYYMPASKAAGNPGPVMVLENQTGPWSLTVVWKFKDGPSDLEWKISPEDAAYREQLFKIAGSKEKAKEIGEKFDSYIANETYNIALQKNDMVSSK